MVLDGWPLTISQVELMKNHHILPAIFVDLQVSEEECTQRAERQSSQTSRYREWTDAMRCMLATAVYIFTRFQHADVLAFFHFKFKHQDTYSCQYCVMILSNL